MNHDAKMLSRAGQLVSAQIRRGEHNAWPASQARLRLVVALGDALRVILDASLADDLGYPLSSKFTPTLDAEGTTSLVVHRRAVRRAGQEAR